MLNALRIGPRLLVLILAQALVLVVIGVTAILGLDFATTSTEQLNRNVSEGTRLGYMADVLREDLLATVQEVREDDLGWAEGATRVAEARVRLGRDWSAFTGRLSGDEREFIDDVLAPELEDANEAIRMLEEIFERRDRPALLQFARTQSEDLVQPFLNSVLASSAEREVASASTFARALQVSELFLYATIAIVVIGVLVSSVLGLLIFRSISRPVEIVARAVGEVAGGNYDARCEIGGSDEIARLGAAFDGLLDDRVASLARSQAENERLNESVIGVLEAVDELSRRNLTVEVPVSPDVTGPVADAINKMAEEFSRVLMQVSHIAMRVGQACARVNDRAAVVNGAAGQQREEVERAAARLAAAAEALGEIAESAGRCAAQAERTSATTDMAMEAVHGTLAGMHEIRDSIQETGKRIKRLGDRSQEITGVVDIISTIAERTHMLALNASMQAASAGEAGRGFGVVADEVQRLAENSRDATRQISALVRNIQIDTNDTIVTMDKTINQVVEGSKLAESAEEQMAVSRSTTAELVENVRRIAAGSSEQSRIGTELREQSHAIVARTVEATDSMAEQVKQTKNLVHYSQLLAKAVRAFRLPKNAGRPDPD